MRVRNIAPKLQENKAVEPSPGSSGFNPNSAAEDRTQKEPGHFNRWWREYQQKMKARLGGTSLQLQVESSR